MKNKTLIILSISLLLFSCGDKKQPEKKIKQETVTKIPEKRKQETKKEVILNALPTKKEEHVHGPGCGHDHDVASSDHVNKMANAQEERIRVAEMMPEEIKEKIAKMVAEKDVKGLLEMCNRLSQMGDFDNAFLIASNYLALAETEIEKKMANSYFANLSAANFLNQNKKLNKENKNDYENIKTLLKDTLENTPDKIDYNHARVVFYSLEKNRLLISQFENDYNLIYKMIDKHYHKLDNYHSQDLIPFQAFMCAYQKCQSVKDYNKAKINIKTLNKMLDFNEKLISKEACPRLPKHFQLQKYKNNLLKYKDYLQKRTK